MWNFDPEERSEIIGGLASQIKKCDKCSLCSGRKGVYPGEGPVTAKVMIISEGPLSDKADELLTKTLNYIKIPRSKAFVTSVTKCKPSEPKSLAADEIEACSGYLDYQLKVIEPRVIIALGKIPTTYMVGSTGKKVAEIIEEDEFYLRSRGDWKFAVIPTYHPSYLLKNTELIKPSSDGLKERIVKALKDLKRR